jgi:hypothetical protein
MSTLCFGHGCQGGRARRSGSDPDAQPRRRAHALDVISATSTPAAPCPTPVPAPAAHVTVAIDRTGSSKRRSVVGTIVTGAGVAVLLAGLGANALSSSASEPCRHSSAWPSSVLCSPALWSAPSASSSDDGAAAAVVPARRAARLDVSNALNAE